MKKCSRSLADSCWCESRSCFSFQPFISLSHLTGVKRHLSSILNLICWYFMFINILHCKKNIFNVITFSETFHDHFRLLYVARFVFILAVNLLIYFTIFFTFPAAELSCTYEILFKVIHSLSIIRFFIICPFLFLWKKPTRLTNKSSTHFLIVDLIGNCQ